MSMLVRFSNMNKTFVHKFVYDFFKTLKKKKEMTIIENE